MIHRLPSAAFFVLDITNDQIGTVNHFTVANLDSGFWMRHGCGVGNLYIGIIIVKVIFVIKVLRGRIRQHQIPKKKKIYINPRKEKTK